MSHSILNAAAATSLLNRHFYTQLVLNSQFFHTVLFCLVLTCYGLMVSPCLSLSSNERARWISALGQSHNEKSNTDQSSEFWFNLLQTKALNMFNIFWIESRGLFMCRVIFVAHTV